MNLSDRIKETVSLRAFAEARGVDWDTRKSRPAKGDWWAPCPLHGEVTPSFHIVEPGGADGWFKCFGCGASGTVIDFAMEIDHLDLKSALARLASDNGIKGDPDPEEQARLERERAARRAKSEAKAAREAESRWTGASLMWRRARRSDAVLDSYLTARGVLLKTLGRVPPTLRFAPDLNHWQDGQNRKVEAPAHKGPAMIAAIGRGTLVGVHRTWINSTGRARFPDDSKVPKKWLGRTGAMFGQPVKLSPTRPLMIVGEGIESTLAGFSAALWAGMQNVSAEAALSRGALSDGAWVPPKGVHTVILLAEGSSKPPKTPGGPTGAEIARAATRSAEDHIRARGIEVHTALPGGRWDRDCDAADIARDFISRT